MAMVSRRSARMPPGCSHQMTRATQRQFHLRLARCFHRIGPVRRARRVWRRQRRTRARAPRHRMGCAPRRRVGQRCRGPGRGPGRSGSPAAAPSLGQRVGALRLGVPAAAARRVGVPAAAARRLGVPAAAARRLGVPAAAARRIGVPAAAARRLGVPASVVPPRHPGSTGRCTEVRQRVSVACVTCGIHTIRTHTSVPAAVSSRRVSSTLPESTLRLPLLLTYSLPPSLPLSLSLSLSRTRTRTRACREAERERERCP
jgi:hypothetical protein